MVIRLERIEAVCLAAAGVLAVSSLTERFVSASGLKWTAMSLSASMAALACAGGLAVSTTEGSRFAKIVRTALALLTALAALASLAAPEMAQGWIPTGWRGTTSEFAGSGAMPWLVAIAFVCLSGILLLARAKSGLAGWFADGMLFGAGWVVLTLLLGAAFGASHVFHAASPARIEPATTAVLTVLTVVAASRRAESGRFSIFLGRSLGSRIARGILPVALLLPMSRELLRARLTEMHLFPEHYAAAFLASAGTMIALGLLMIVSWQLRRLEWEIQSLSLRDELTGLYNLRGFQLLAEQALRMAQRSRAPFSVLFVDVDDLKQINDRLGHAVGSQTLEETAEFLKTQFRETDVLGRIGGDEFAVAGQFSVEAIELAEARLEAKSSEAASDGRPHLSLSMGHVMADLRRHEKLQDLLDRADAAMYERKRLKKVQEI
jgi:diguanylate cyclase (GGDEF)-like protein